jgi:hypothetical protein
MSDEFTTQLENDSADIYARIMAGEDVISVDVDIKEIDEVIVEDVCIHFYGTGKSASMEIYVTDSLSGRFRGFEMEDQVEMVTLENIQVFMKKVATTLRSLRFDAMSTTFVKRPRKRNCWEFFECETVKMEHGSCACHCGGVTRRKTKCGHHLCLRCEQKIKFNDDVKPCPICRMTIDERRILIHSDD